MAVTHNSHTSTNQCREQTFTVLWPVGSWCVRIPHTRLHVLRRCRRYNRTVTLRLKSSGARVRNRAVALRAFFSKQNFHQINIVGLHLFFRQSCFKPLERKLLSHFFCSLNFPRRCWAPKDEKYGFLFQLKHCVLIINFSWVPSNT